MNTSAANFKIVVTTCTAPIFFTPARLIAAGTHNPTNTNKMDPSLLPSLLMNTSTYNTHPTAMAAFPAHAVIQYDHAFANPKPLPYATREYAYGPPSAGK